MHLYRILLFCGTIALAVMPSQALEFRTAYNGGNCVGCEWVQASGLLEKGDAERFENFVSQQNIKPYRNHNILYFDSTGGNLIAGIKLGKVIRKLGFTTAIGSTAETGSDDYKMQAVEDKANCISACAYSFLGGKFRQLSFSSLNSCLGFHQFFNPKLLEASEGVATVAQVSTQLISGLIIEYLNEIKVDVRIYAFASKFKGEEFGCITTKESKEFEIDNSSDIYTEWDMVPFAKGIIAEVKAGRTNRKIRVYCSSNGPHLAYFFPSVYFTNLNGISTGKYAVKLVLKSGNLSIEPKIRLVQKSKDTKTVIIVLDISKRFVTDLSKSNSINAFNTDVPRVLQGLINAFEFNLAGDPRAITLALKNCI